MLSEKKLEALKKRLSETARPTQPRLTPEQREGLVDDFLSDDSLTIAELARRYGISHQTAAYHLKKHLD